MKFLERIIGFIFWLFWVIFFIVFTIIWGSTLMMITYLTFGKLSKLAHWFAKIWGKVLVYASFSHVKKYQVENLKNLNSPVIIISNHQSAFDIFLSLGFYPIDYVFISKQSIFNIPLFGFQMKTAGYIPVDRSNPRKAAASLIAAIKKIKSGFNVLIYPEGERSRDPDVIQPFKAGALFMAQKGEIPLLPIITYNTAGVLPRNRRFYLMPKRMKLVVLKPINLENELHPSNLNSPLSAHQKLEHLRLIFVDAFDKLKNNKI